MENVRISENFQLGRNKYLNFLGGKRKAQKVLFSHLASTYAGLGKHI